MQTYQIVILTVYIAMVLFDYWLDYINLKHVQRFGATIPSEFANQIDQTLLTQTRRYLIDKTYFALVASAVNHIVVIVFMFGGFLNLYNSWIASFGLSFIASGLVFFMLLTYGETIVSTPFSLYQTFKIEKKYGFNTTTPRLWISDFLKSFVISSILMALLLGAGLWLMQWSQGLWWLWLWAFFFAFSLFLMYIAPYVIEPLFNKFTPIEGQGLEEAIIALMEKAGIHVSRVFKMDASKRSAHTNAYFTGIGKVKRIVLYDTLLEKLTDKEILSVLAHEVGHWKKKHVIKRIIVTEGVALIGFYIAYWAIQGDWTLRLFSIEQDAVFAKLIILGFLSSIITFPISPLSAYWSRKQEKEADQFAYQLTGNVEGMISALVKLSKDNLSNLHPHPFYAAFSYSHPPVLERIRYIRNLQPSIDSSMRQNVREKDSDVTSPKR
jgi:STE24 endopeptidase